MKNILVIGVVLIALVTAWFILNPGDSFDHVVVVQDEVAALEAELVEIEAAANAGLLTPTQAADARARVITRLAAIESAAGDSEAMELTPDQRTQLSAGLAKLQSILLTYQATLITVEEMAAETPAVAEERRRSGRSYQTLTLQVAETVEAVEETVQDSVQDYEPDPEVTEDIDTIIADEEELVDDMASSTDAAGTDDEDGMSDPEPMTDEENATDETDASESDESTMDESEPEEETVQ